MYIKTQLHYVNESLQHDLTYNDEPSNQLIYTLRRTNIEQLYLRFT